MSTMNNEDPAAPSVHEPRGRDWPEPVAWARNLADPQPHCVTSLSYRSVADADANVRYEPLYTADQMREAIAAERERSHELLQAADHIRAGLEAELAALRASAASVQADQRAEIDAANAEKKVLQESLASEKKWGELWYFVSDEEPLAFETIVSQYAPKRWIDQAYKLMAARALRKGTT